MIKQKAVENFKNGYSCSESIVKAAIDEGLIPSEFLSCATSFSGGMGSGCLCGAIAGSQMVIGYIHGRGKTEKARALAKEFIEEFKKSHKGTCCKVLTAGLDFHSSERKAHCTNMVFDCGKILETILEKELTKA